MSREFVLKRLKDLMWVLLISGTVISGRFRYNVSVMPVPDR